MMITALVCLSLGKCVSTPVDVLDGASFRSGGETVRLRDIDVPRADGRCPTERMLAAVAQSALAQALAGKSLEINRTGRALDGRTMAGVTADGFDVARALLSRGYARRMGDTRGWCRH